MPVTMKETEGGGDAEASHQGDDDDHRKQQ